MQWQQVLCIRNITIENPFFPTTHLKVFLILKTGLNNLASTWKKQVAHLSRVVISHFLNKPETVFTPKKERKIRALKKEAHSITQHMSVSGKNAAHSQKTRVPVPILLLALKLSGFIFPFAKGMKPAR